MDRELIGEPIEPDLTSFDRGAAAAGEPALPWRFLWRGRAYEVTGVTRRWKTTNDGPYHQGDVYVRRHYAELTTACGEQMRVYGERGGRAARWFLHSRGR